MVWSLYSVCSHDKFTDYLKVGTAFCLKNLIKYYHIIIHIKETTENKNKSKREKEKAYLQGLLIIIINTLSCYVLSVIIS